MKLIAGSLGTANVRNHYAEAVCREAGIVSAEIKRAFAIVPRERFLRPPPWTLLTKEGPRQTPNGDLKQVYANVLIELDGKRGINNGLPSLWARTLAAAEITADASVLHVGAGSGYYTAIIGELVGPRGSVLGVEIDPSLAAMAMDVLATYPQIQVINGNGLEVDTPPVDVIVASAGLSTIPKAWLDRLKTMGRLVVPLTVVGDWPKPGGGTWHGGSGGMLVIRRLDPDYSAQFLSGVGFIPCVGAESSTYDNQLRRAFANKDMSAVRSLHRYPKRPDKTCWVAGKDWWLSTREPQIFV